MVARASPATGAGGVPAGEAVVGVPRGGVTVGVPAADSAADAGGRGPGLATDAGAATAQPVSAAAQPAASSNFPHMPASLSVAPDTARAGRVPGRAGP